MADLNLQHLRQHDLSSSRPAQAYMCALMDSLMFESVATCRGRKVSGALFGRAALQPVLCGVDACRLLLIPRAPTAACRLGFVYLRLRRYSARTDAHG